MRALAEDVKARLSRMDILVNNAGIGVFMPFEERADGEFSSVVDINLRGTFHGIDAFRPLLAARAARS